MSILNPEQAKQITELITASLLEKLGPDIAEMLVKLTEFEMRIMELETQMEKLTQEADLLRNDMTQALTPPPS